MVRPSSELVSRMHVGLLVNNVATSLISTTSMHEYCCLFLCGPTFFV